jgi:hypothetical protein
MILTHRLVRLIERHSEELSSALVLHVSQSPALPSYRNVPVEELHQRVSDLYQHLGDWLLGKAEVDIRKRYAELAARRYHQGVPLSELIWAILLTKENLWDFLNRESFPGFEAVVLAEHEWFRMLDKFFNHAIHYAAIGYEEAVLRERSATKQVA